MRWLLIPGFIACFTLSLLLQRIPTGNDIAYNGLAHLLNIAGWIMLVSFVVGIFQRKSKSTATLGERNAALAREKNARILHEKGELEKAQVAYRECIEVMERLDPVDPGNATFFREVVDGLGKVGEAFVDRGDQPRNLACRRDVVTIGRLLMAGAPQNPRSAEILAVALQRLGTALGATGDMAGARSAWEEALSLAHGAAKGGKSLNWIRFRAVIHSRIAELGEGDAQAHWTQAQAFFEELERHQMLPDGDRPLLERARVKTAER